MVCIQYTPFIQPMKNILTKTVLMYVHCASHIPGSHTTIKSHYHINTHQYFKIMRKLGTQIINNLTSNVNVVPT